MTQWAVRGSLRRVLVGGCDAMRCERQFKGAFWRAYVTQWVLEMLGLAVTVASEKQVWGRFWRELKH